MQPTSLNVHRLLITGVLLAAKLMDDNYFNNAYYAKASSADVIVDCVGWHLLSSPEEYCKKITGVMAQVVHLLCRALFYHALEIFVIFSLIFWMVEGGSSLSDSSFVVHVAVFYVCATLSTCSSEISLWCADRRRRRRGAEQAGIGDDAAAGLPPPRADL